MIPTSVTSSPAPETACSSASGNSASLSNAAQQNAFLSSSFFNAVTFSSSSSAMLGIAALILEGRAIAVEEYQLHHQLHQQQQHHQQTQHQQAARAHTDAPLFGGRIAGGVGGTTTAKSCAGRQSPLPSTSRAGAGSMGAGVVINITANPHAYFATGRGGGGGGGGGGGSTVSAGGPPFQRYMEMSHASSRGGGVSSSSSASASSAESTHQRWTQKLCQLRQASPAASHGATYEPKLSLEVQPEVVALAMNAESRSERGDYEIVRRAMLNRANLAMPVTAIATPTASAVSVLAGTSAVGALAGAAGSGNSSPGSENFLYSLQSLATTCLRGASPSAAAIAESPSYRYAALRSASPLLSTPRFPYPGAVGAHEAPCSASSSGSGVQSPERSLWTPVRAPKVGDGGRGGCSKKLLTTTRRIPIPSATVTSASSSGNLRLSLLATGRRSSPPAAGAAPAASVATPSPSRYPQQGPHCDQFLRKMGLAKGEAADAEDHICDMSYVNITCSRWRAYCMKIEPIVARGEAVCIEVYLGPVNHQILLEQWIITQKEKVPPPTMTLPSLCSAIRSQLYFSQISAWCDLLKKDARSVYETGRIIYPTATGAAGDLATPACSPPSTHAHTTTSSPTSAMDACAQRRPRLNIFYRVKRYDASAAFSAQPNVHNFPNVNYSENCSISVCLKSLPRINGGIPRIVPSVTAAPPSPAVAAVSSTTATAAAAAVNAAPEPATTPTTTAKTMPKIAANDGGGAGAEGCARTAISDAAVVATTSGELFSQFAVGRFASSSSSLNCDRNGGTTADATAAAAQLATAARAANGSSNGNAGAARNGADNSKDSRRPRWNFYIDDDEDDGSEEDEELESGGGYDELDADDDGNTSDYTNGAADSSNSSFSSSAHLSHREKQLLKYRKHMLKRDKKHRQPLLDDSTEQSRATGKHEPQLEQRPKCGDRLAAGGINYRLSVANATVQPSKVNNGVDEQQQHQPMEEGGEENATPKQMKSQPRQPQPQQQAIHTQMISTGTQTQMMCCPHCGSEKTLLCLRCSGRGGIGGGVGGGGIVVDGDDMDSSSSISSSEIIRTPRNKADLLLQAIQRTPKAAKKHKKQIQRMLNNAATKATPTSPTIVQNNNHVAATGLGASVVAPATSAARNANAAGGGCQVCKRQKTQHDFANGGAKRESNAETETDAAAIDYEHVVAEADCVGEGEGAGEESHETMSCNGQLKGGGEERADDAPAKCDDNDGEQRNVAIEFVDTAEGDAAEAESVEFHAEGAATERHMAAEDVMEEESFYTRTKLTPHIDRCSLSGTNITNSRLLAKQHDGEQPHQQHAYNNNNSKSNYTADECQRSCTPPKPSCGFFLTDCDDAARATQFKTPTTTMTTITTITCSQFQQQQQQQYQPHQEQQQQQQQQQQQPQALHHHQHQHQLTPKPQLLQVMCNYQRGDGGDCNVSTTSRSALLLRKGLPKVNLTPIFCGPAPQCSAANVRSLSAPIAIAHENGHERGERYGRLLFEDATPTASTSMAFCFDAPTAVVGRSTLLPTAAMASNIPVQKSFSAPTLPNSPSPSLSPRFAKQAAIYKRRSRHLSDRSDRSSLGSDEQFSDEDFDSAAMYSSPATSPLKNRARIAAVFGRQPLLGNLEESLLQKRLMPKIEVAGFKVLLGASGGFCPTQLTIPASAYFYELHGESLSTPYVCEIRLPRKGYTVPRIGTVQATLLNPMGTVVRMFVIPYDLSDMPNLRQTFIRQRVLAEAGGLNERRSTAQTCAFGGSDGVGASSGAGAQSKHYVKSGFGTTPTIVDSITSFANGYVTTAAVAGANNNNNNNSCLGHFISAEHMKRLRYSIHLRFQTSRTGRLSLHTDIRLLIARRTDCDTAAAHAKGVLEAPNDLVTDTVMPLNPKYSSLHHENTNKI